jgi:hypothetical protein
MDYAKLAAQFGAIQPQQQPQQTMPNWAGGLSPKDSAELNMKLYQEGRKRLAELDAEVSKGSGMMADLDRFGYLNRRSATGGVWENVLPSVNFLHGADENEMNAIQSRLGPGQRIEGSGASSDRDVSLFMSGIPNIQQTGPVNAAIRRQFEKKYKEAIDKRNAMRQHLNQHGNLNDFDAAWTRKATQGWTIKRKD